MAIKNAIKDYVKNFYEITYDPKHKQIMLHDCNETYSNRNYIDIGRVGRVKITLVWGKIEEITGVAYHHKNFYSELSKLFFEIVTEQKSKDFFNLLLIENIHVNFGISEIIEQFPILND